MSAVKITAALEQALAAMSPSLPTALKNEAFTPPPADAPYQRATVLFASPDNSEYGPNYREQGFLQVDLYYPLKTGWGAAIARAELIRSTFRRGASFIKGGVTITISATPAIIDGADDPAHDVQIVRIPFHANIAT